MCVVAALALRRRRSRRSTARGDDVLVVRAVEDPDVAARGSALMDAPEEVVRGLGRRRHLERLHVAALRIEAGEHAPDRAVLARRVEALQHEQHRAGALGVEPPVQDAEPIGQRGQLRLGPALRRCRAGRRSDAAGEIRLRSGLDPARVAHGRGPYQPSLHVLRPSGAVPVAPPAPNPAGSGCQPGRDGAAYAANALRARLRRTEPTISNTMPVTRIEPADSRQHEPPDAERMVSVNGSRHEHRCRRDVPHGDRVLAGRRGREAHRVHEPIAAARSASRARSPRSNTATCAVAARSPSRRRA